MPDDQEIERKFWKALRSDMTVMLGLDAPDQIPPRPMTAQLDGDADHGPIWFFTAKSATLTHHVAATAPASFTFTDKGHNIWAAVQGRLSVSNDRAVIDRLWNPYIAAWYEGGKDDPELTLLRFDPAEAEIWIDGSSLFAGLRVLLGSDPKQDYKDNIAKVSLG